MRFTGELAELANGTSQGTLVEHLDIRFAVDEEGRLTASMPVDHRTHQPLGLLHGGATAALAETLGSTGSYMMIDRQRKSVVGIEINANHLRGVRTGRVTATGKVIHAGRTTHVWDIQVHDQEGRLCAVCRLTNLIIDNP